MKRINVKGLTWKISEAVTKNFEKRRENAALAQKIPGDRQRADEIVSWLERNGVTSKELFFRINSCERQIVLGTEQNLGGISRQIREIDLPETQRQRLLEELALAERLFKDGKMPEIQSAISVFEKKLFELEKLSNENLERIYNEAKQKVPKEFLDVLRAMIAEESAKRQNVAIY